MELRATDAARLYQSARPGTEPVPNRPSMGEVASDAVASFAATLQNAETTAKDAIVGKADTQALVEALAQSELAVETAVTLRNKVVEAYQEILRMPV